MTLILENSGHRSTIEALWEDYDTCSDSKLFMALAEQLRRRGSYGEAIDICSRAKANHPRYISCRVLLGKCFSELGMQKEAASEAEAVLQMDRENVFSLRLLAERKLAQGSVEEAADYYRALLRINPRDLEVQEKLARMVRIFEGSGGSMAVPGSSQTEVSLASTESQLEVSASKSPGYALVPRVPSAPEEEMTQDLPLKEALQAVLAEGSTGQKARLAWHLEDPHRALGGRDRPHEASDFFDYTNSSSDVSLFAGWIEAAREKR
jgi:tetratricopeptide (TPR) repeat protein